MMLPRSECWGPAFAPPLKRILAASRGAVLPMVSVSTQWARLGRQQSRREIRRRSSPLRLH
eukprot:5610287-Pyramimonas_sp.AAC.2